MGVAVLSPSTAHAAIGVLDTKDDESTSMNTGEVSDAFPKLGSEYYIVRLLPLKNIVFRTIEQNLLGTISILRSLPDVSNQENIERIYSKSESSITTALSILSSKRSELEPVVNPDDSTEMAVMKAERGGKLISDLTLDLEYLKESVHKKEHKMYFRETKKCFIDTWISWRVACEGISVRSTV